MAPRAARRPLFPTKIGEQRTGLALALGGRDDGDGLRPSLGGGHVVVRAEGRLRCAAAAPCPNEEGPGSVFRDREPEQSIVWRDHGGDGCYSAGELAVPWSASRGLGRSPIFHKCDETIRGHMFCSFLALLLQKELFRRMAAAGIEAEWADILRDLDALTEIDNRERERGQALPGALALQGRNRRHPALRRRAAAAHHTLHRRAGRRERKPCRSLTIHIGPNFGRAAKCSATRRILIAN